MKPIEFKLEKKLVRELGSIAILILLMKEPDGIHAYDLGKRVEKIVYSHKQKIFAQLNDILLLNKQIIKNFSIRDDSAIEKKNEIKSLIEENFFFKHSSLIKQLLISNDSEQILSSINSIKMKNENISKMISKIANHTEVWKDISGIYPVLNHLLQNELVRIKEEQPIEGRLRKIYEITPKGKEFAISSQWSILEITEFIIPFRDLSMKKENKFPNASLSPIKALISELDIENIDEDQLLLEIENSTFLTLFKVMFYPIIIESIIRTNEPSKIIEILEKTESENEKLLFKTIFRSALENIQANVSEALRLLN